MASTSYDHVIVGGGHNALAAAVHLSAHGRSVIVLEANKRVGGAAATQEVTLPGYRHDLAAMNLSLFAGSPFAQAYGPKLAEHGLAYAPVSDCFANPFPDGRWLGISNDLEKNASRIAAFDSADAERWRAMTEAFSEDAPHYFALLGTPMRLRPLLRLAVKTLRAKGRPWTVDAIRLLLASPREFLDENFNSPHLKATLAPWAMHLDFPPDASGGALFPYLESMADQAFGMVLGKGGASVIPQALEGLLKATGGEVRTGTTATSIEVNAGRAVAVKSDDGEVFRAKEAILASLTPQSLLAMVGSTGKAPTDAALKGWKHGPGTMMIHIACDALPPWTAGEELQKFAYVHLAPTLALLSQTYAQATEGLLPAEPGIVVGQPTAIDPSRAPDGKHVLWLQVRVVPATILGDAAGEISAHEWSEAKEAMADRVMAILERYAPGVSGSVLARTVHSPQDLEAFNRNLVGGDSLGGSHHLRQNFMLRPAFGMAGHRTPIKGLYHIGSSTWPGAGVGAGSGYLAAKDIVGG
ncbi:MAG: NAD(P)/FAD-dependent oxidoreductase [Pseudomonadota bacterium]